MDVSGNLYFISSVDAQNLTEEWVIERIVCLLDELRAKDAEAIASEWQIDWPDN